MYFNSDLGIAEKSPSRPSARSPEVGGHSVGTNCEPKTELLDENDMRSFHFIMFAIALAAVMLVLTCVAIVDMIRHHGE
jgi:hypothetical protein